MDRRQFLLKSTLTLGAAGLSQPSFSKPHYNGPNIIIIRFGGGVRRQDVIDPNKSYAPFFQKYLMPKGTLFSNTELTRVEGIGTSHMQGTLQILTGKYQVLKDFDGGLGERFVSLVPTLFECFRKQYAVPAH